MHGNYHRKPFNPLASKNIIKMVCYSHSRLSTFEQCALKFKFKYIDELIPDIEQTIEGFLGNKVHDTLEWIYNQVANNNLPQLDNAIYHFVFNWKNDFNQDIKIVKQEFDAEYYFNLGTKFIIDYFTTNYPFKDNTIATEKKVIVNLGSDETYELQGYIDRLVHNKNTNIFEIHDYKTSGFLKSQKELDNDRQLALYSLAIKNDFPEAKEIHLVWHFLAFNKKMISKRTEEQLENLKQEIIQLIQKIESTTEFKPNPSRLCKWCEFKTNCPLFKNGYVDLTK